ncbi:MAG: YkgJ family cysteine cluster protein [Candidatus Omnitrophica bacterium]|nr:YkgJ family cysteine cluster protein [Candidatus Omnitrophota bacterium]
MIRQLVPESTCLKCQGCCRFKEINSVWTPCLLEEEVQDLIDQDIPPAYINMQKKINPIPNPKGEGFVCAFFASESNKCKIYAIRPFECQLYPFLINLRDKKVVLTVDLNCPYIEENIGKKEFKEYVSYLSSYLNSPEQLEMLKDNPQIIQAYEDVLDVIELKLFDGDK